MLSLKSRRFGTSLLVCLTNYEMPGLLFEDVFVFLLSVLLLNTKERFNLLNHRLEGLH